MCADELDHCCADHSGASDALSFASSPCGTVRSDGWAVASYACVALVAAVAPSAAGAVEAAEDGVVKVPAGPVAVVYGAEMAECGSPGSGVASWAPECAVGAAGEMVPLAGEAVVGL